MLCDMAMTPLSVTIMCPSSATIFRPSHSIESEPLVSHKRQCSNGKHGAVMLVRVRFYTSVTAVVE